MKKFRAYHEKTKTMYYSQPFVRICFDGESFMLNTYDSTGKWILTKEVRVDELLFTCNGQNFYENDIAYISGTGNCIVSMNIYTGVTFTSVEDKNNITNLHDATAEQEDIILKGNIYNYGEKQ